MPVRHAELQGDDAERVDAGCPEELLWLRTARARVARHLVDLRDQSEQRGVVQAFYGIGLATAGAGDGPPPPVPGQVQEVGVLLNSAFECSPSAVNTEGTQNESSKREILPPGRHVISLRAEGIHIVKYCVLFGLIDAGAARIGDRGIEIYNGKLPRDVLNDTRANQLPDRLIADRSM